MIVIESPFHEKHHPDWSFTIGNFTFNARDVPKRVHLIKSSLATSKTYSFLPSRVFPEKHIKILHPYHDYIKTVCSKIKDNSTQLLPDIFPGFGFQPRKQVRSPNEMGYYCSSAVTPLLKNTYRAAKGSVDAALTGAQLIASEKAFEVYALCRPPGHHAGPRVFGGYCYFNNVATAAHWLSKRGKVAILDIDYHHGDGTQEHFLERNDVFTCSIHGDPKKDYPFLTGFKEEIGLKKGQGANKNFPLPLNTSISTYLKTLRQALKLIKYNKPKYLVLAAGFDTYEGDPVGHFNLKIKDYALIGHEIGKLKIPTLICQEGGYNLSDLGKCVRVFLDAFANARA